MVFADAAWFPPPDVALVAAVFLGGLIRAAQMWQWSRETTLRAPCVWLLVSWLTLGLVELTTWAEDGVKAMPWRYVASVGLVCPAVAVLGAKRPQDRGWQFIVATLWLVLALPVGPHWVRSSSRPLSLHPVVVGMVVILLAMHLMNYLPTRYGLTAIVSSMAASAFLWRALHPEGHGVSDGLAWGLAALSWWLVPATRRSKTPPGWNRVWIDFRDAFGAVWGLRVLERVHQVLAADASAGRLHWFGWDEMPSTPTGVSPSAHDAPWETAFRGILRRFVSDGWIAARCAAKPTRSGPQ